MTYLLPTLPYAYDDLEPFYDARTLEIHHGKHHAGYVSNLNRIMADHTDYGTHAIEEVLSNLESLPTSIRGGVRDQGGGHANHSLFWRTMGVAKNQAPRNELNDAILAEFKSLENLRTAFTEKATSVFGSGWTWLCVDQDADLRVMNTVNHENPLSTGLKPILVLDIWEHAYYLGFQNRRKEWIESWWNIINWDEVLKIYNRIRGGKSLTEIYV